MDSITPAETIANHADLLTEILLRLPTKTLVKLKCVSRQWLSLISSPYFYLCYTRHHQTNGFLTPTSLLLNWYHTLPFVDSTNYGPNINVLQSCYGLFLCKSVVDDISNYFVYNPPTKNFKKLSYPGKPFQRFRFYVSMAFDPLKSPHYKIICVRKVSDSKHELDIYSSETDSWSLCRISFDVDEENFIRFEDAVFCNGKIHWNGKDPLYFDVDNERLEPLPLPILTPERERERECSYLGECRGVLYIAVTYLEFDCLEFDVFEMASDYSHWFQKYHLDMGDLYLCDVCITQFEKEKEPKIVVRVRNKIKFYDLTDGTWKSIYDLRPGIHFNGYSINPYRSIKASLFFENLSSI